VVLQVDVDANGKVGNAVVEHAEPAGVFDQAALDAARQWRFTPKVENGHAVPSRIMVPVRFEAQVAPPAAPQAPGA